MPESSPALKYRFWVTPALRKAGSVMPHITRAQLFYFDRPNISQLRKEYADRTEAWQEGPIDQMPKDEVRTYLNEFKKTLDELHQASKLERIDYDLRTQDLRGTDVFTFLLPEVQNQNYRDLARLISLEARLAIADRRFDDAMRSLQTGFRLNEVASAGGGNLIIGKLIGLAVTGMMLELVEEMIQQPGAPNMYWALMSLPDSMWNMREAFEGESTVINRLLGPAFEGAIDGSPPVDASARLVTGLRNLMSIESENPSTDESTVRLLAGLLLIVYGDRSRTELASSESDAERVAAWSRPQSVIEAFGRGLNRAQDDFFKFAVMPAELRTAYSERAYELFKSRSGIDFTDPATITLGLLLPAVQAAQAACQRTETARNRLATIEALRAYAALNKNALPESLAQLTSLPALRNPQTDQSFLYRRVGETEAVIQMKPFYPRDPNAESHLKIIARENVKPE